jgi:antibiotic biosynthesis monooxygenase (ABM) superfamily enzyme
MGKNTNISHEKAVTVVISRRVLPGHDRDYTAWVHRLVDSAIEAPGNTGATMLTPGPNKAGLYHVVLRFADYDSMHSWEDSYERQKLSHEADAFSTRIRQEGTGLETWFTLPEHPEFTPPPPWKIFLITSMAAYVLTLIIIPIEQHFLKWPFPLLNIVTSIVMVGILTWAVMPVLSRYVFRKWLYKE